MKPVQITALLFLAALTFFLWGLSMVAFEVFPHRLLQPVIEDVKAWLGGVDEGEQLTLGEKIGADFLGRDTRYAHEAPAAEKLGLELQSVTDPMGLLADSKHRLKYVSNVSEGYFVFYTVLNLPDAKFAAVVVSARGELVNVIPVPEAVHDLGQGGITEDGNFVFNAGKRLFVTDACGRERLNLADPGVDFHHRTSGYDNTVWVWNGNKAQLFDLTSGEVLKQFSLIDLIGANEHTPIFEARLTKKNIKGPTGQWKYGNLRDDPDMPLAQIALVDPFHHNDVDVLSPRMAAQFPDFDAGDLLLSFRSINLITVVDQDTLKVKWYSYGQFSRQHDPDWGYNGEIIVYDNKSHSTYSRIISIDVATKHVSELVNGQPLAFYRFAGGNQHVHTDGRVLFNNGAEALQVDKEGELTFYFQTQNFWGDPVMITTVRYVTEEEYGEWTADCQS